MSGILVYIQLENNDICSFSYDLISQAKEISNGFMISGVIVSHLGFELKEEHKNNLKKYGADRLYILKTKAEHYDKRNHPYHIIELIKKTNPDIFILTSTTEGREIAPVVASSLNTGLTADCTKIDIVDNKLISTRPTFGGKLMASVLCKTKPQMATIRQNIFKKKDFTPFNKTDNCAMSFEKSLKNTGETSENKPIEVTEYDFNVNKNFKTEILEFEKDNKNSFYNIQNAKIIFAGGMGLKNKEYFDKLKLLAGKYGAKVGGTRKAADKGFIEKELQIGQTGLCVTPEIYVAFGISGAIHHIMGMENAKKIIAVNTDKNAPVFNYSDIGIIGDARKIIDELLEEN